MYEGFEGFNDMTHNEDTQQTLYKTHQKVSDSEMFTPEFEGAEITGEQSDQLVVSPSTVEQSNTGS